MVKEISSEKPKILYIDDERPNLIAFRTMLHDTYEVLIALNTDEAFQLLKTQRIPLVVSDQRMPEITGVQFLEKVAREFPDTVRMLLTGYSDIDAVIEAVNRCQIFFYFKKPWNENEIRLVLSHALNAIEMKQKLIQSEQRFRHIFQNAGIGIAHLDMKGQILIANQRFLKITGIQNLESHQKPITECFEEVKFSNLEKLSTGEKSILSFESNVKNFPEIRRVKITISLSRDFNGNTDYFIALIDDLTEKRRTEEALQNIQRVETLGVLAGGIAHDFNNLLSAIYGNLEMAQLTCKSNDLSATASYISDSLSVFARTKDLVQQLSAFTKKGAPSKRPLSLVPLIKKFAHFILVGSNINIDYVFPENLWTCDVDENQICQVIGNIVLNARQAMNNNGKVVVTAENFSNHKKQVLSLSDKDYVLVKISDNGPGIPVEILPRIFDPFFTTKKEGTGLGLATTFTIMRKHDGLITVESEIRKGTTFSLFFPASKMKAKNVEDSQHEQFTCGAKILIIDDEENVRIVYENLLKSVGCKVETVSDANAAISLYKSRLNSSDRFDLVILDLISTGGIGGEETFTKLKLLDPNVSAIAASGSSNEPAISEPSKFGFSASLVKPFRKEELYEVIKNIYCKNN
ncbi:MAG: response regulator [Candidatus Riflebacteria bacterium]|nr:response regulator [Candidatus Riflebacteria bacterium]